MRVSAVNNMPFRAKLSEKLLSDAIASAKTPMQQEYLEKRIKEIETYGDENTVIEYKFNNVPIAG
ncbi:hypothetical protein J6A31_02540, partial [bacterium]|nr:hypothetical protein [bacterium]